MGFWIRKSWVISKFWLCVTVSLLSFLTCLGKAVMSTSQGSGKESVPLILGLSMGLTKNWNLISRSYLGSCPLEFYPQSTYHFQTVVVTILELTSNPLRTWPTHQNFPCTEPQLKAWVQITTLVPPYLWSAAQPTKSWCNIKDSV